LQHFLTMRVGVCSLSMKHVAIMRGKLEEQPVCGFREDGGHEDFNSEERATATRSLARI